jgi:hypothetical protein
MKAWEKLRLGLEISLGIHSPKLLTARRGGAILLGLGPGLGARDLAPLQTAHADFAFARPTLRRLALRPGLREKWSSTTVEARCLASTG